MDQNLQTKLETALATATRRLRWRDVSNLLPRFLLGGLLFIFLLLIAIHLLPFLLQNETLPTYISTQLRALTLFNKIFLLSLLSGLLLTSVMSMIAYLWLRTYSPVQVARHLDQALHLDERLSTAVELTSQPRQIAPNIVQSQLLDAVDHIIEVNFDKAIPLQLRWPMPVSSLLLAIAICAMIFYPNRVLPTWVQQAQPQATQPQEIETAFLDNEALIESLQESNVDDQLEPLLEELIDPNQTPAEQLATLAEAEETLTDLQEAGLTQQQMLNDVAQSLAQSNLTADTATALQNGDLSQSSASLRSAADSLSATDPANLSELADAMEQAAEAAGDSAFANALGELSQSLQSLANSTSATQSEALDAAQSAMQQAADALENMEEQIEELLANQDALQEALDNIQAAREQLVQSGQDQSGQGESGQGGSGQSQSGQGQSGQGQSGEGQSAGTGQGNGDASSSSGGSGPGQGQGQGQGSEGLGYSDSNRPDTYNPTLPSLFIGGEGGPIFPLDEQGSSNGIPLAGVPSDPDRPAGPALVPYDQVYGEYSDAANQALEDNYIPLGMKEFVRNYFGALEP